MLRIFSALIGYSPADRPWVAMVLENKSRVEFGLLAQPAAPVARKPIKNRLRFNTSDTPDPVRESGIERLFDSS